MPGASIFLPSYNKPFYVLDAIESVLAQTSQDWELWVVENSTDGMTREVIKASGFLADPRIIYREIDVGPAVRAMYYVTAWLMNYYYPQANADLIFFLADDDLFVPGCVDTCLKHFAANPEWMVANFGMHGLGSIGNPNKKIWTEVMVMPPVDRAAGDGRMCAVIDGGQVVHRKSCLDALIKPCIPQDVNPVISRQADGYFLEKLLEHFDFHAIGRILGIHRATPVSCWTQYRYGQRHLPGLENKPMEPYDFGKPERDSGV